MAVVSSDHADASLSAAGLQGNVAQHPRRISVEELRKHNADDAGDALWGVVDGFVVSVSGFSHPGGLRKLQSVNSAGAGHTGNEFGFSFSRGRNAHFPATGRAFREGVERYLRGDGGHKDNVLLPVEVVFPEYGKIVILGKLTA